jgi:hypothetical protein
MAELEPELLRLEDRYNDGIASLPDVPQTLPTLIVPTAPEPPLPQQRKAWQAVRAALLLLLPLSLLGTFILFLLLSRL